MLDSNDALVQQFLDRSRMEDAQFYVVGMIYDAYFTMNKDEWLNQENKDYRYATEKRFKEYWLKYKKLHDSIPQDIKTQRVMCSAVIIRKAAHSRYSPPSQSLPHTP